MIAAILKAHESAWPEPTRGLCWALRTNWSTQVVYGWWWCCYTSVANLWMPKVRQLCVAKKKTPYHPYPAWPALSVSHETKAECIECILISCYFHFLLRNLNLSYSFYDVQVFGKAFSHRDSKQCVKVATKLAMNLWNLWNILNLEDGSWNGHETVKTWDILRFS